MARIARCADPLYQTRGDPLRLPIAFTDPTTGTPLDPTGATVTAVLVGGGASRPLSVSALDATCRAVITGSGALTADLPLGQPAELQVAFVDAGGMVQRYVWDVVGEVP